MDRNKILEDIEEIFEICQERNIGSNETELDIRETITDYIVKKLTLTDVSQRSELFKSFLQKVVQETEVGDLTWQTRDEAKELLKLLNCG